MWIKVNNYIAVNLDTNVTLEIEEEKDLVYKTEYFFKTKIPIGQDFSVEKTGVWSVIICSKGRRNTIRQGTERECIALFDYLLKKSGEFLDFSKEV